MVSVTVNSLKRVELIDITDRVVSVVKKSGVRNGVCRLFVPHTTAGITINENADPSVRDDIIGGLAELVPEEKPYRHVEGNADAHIKASLMGSDKSVFVEDGGLRLGRWQGIFFCEFDGPRTREVWVDITG